MPIYLKVFILLWLATSYIAQATAQEVKITLPKQKIRLTYNQDVRLSQIFTDAYPYVSHEIYSLGVALIDPSKQPIVNAKKETVFEQLKQLNTPEAANVLKQLSSLDFMYRETIETNINKVRFLSESNPLIKKDYTLLLPSRPDHITLFSGAYDKSLPIALKANYHLKDYLSELPNNKRKRHHQAWIIQANQDVYLAKDIQWQRTLYYLTPGAYVFIGLDDLPKQHKTLNTDIAELLTFYLEP